MVNKTKTRKFNIEREKHYMEYCSKCFKQHGNKCIATDCFIGKFDMEIRDFYLETELWNKIFHNESVKDCKHFIVSYQGFNIENNNINPKHIMLAKYQLIQCVNCGKILGIVKPKKPKRKFRVY